VDVIGVDGQTIYQEPPDHAGMRALAQGATLVDKWLDGPYPCGMQIGESSLIAAHTNITTVTHFRPADHAFGGTGAPLMQYLDFVAFRDIAPVLTLNIGGIANCHLVQRDRSKMMAFDTGPGNVMLDHTARRLCNQSHDPGGAIAASGTINRELLAELLEHPYFQRRPPRSAWRLDFGAGYADAMLDKYHSLRPEDLMATFTAFTAEAIVMSLNDYISDLSGLNVLIASGGGTRNPTLMKMLRELLPAHLRLTTSDE
jgi:anhydro-N-acetylmuramic acid kinase